MAEDRDRRRTLGHGPLRLHRHAISGGEQRRPDVHGPDHTGDVSLAAWTSGSSPNPRRAPPTTISSRWRSGPNRSGSGPSSGPTTTAGSSNPGGLPGPTDAWITLAGLARDTSTIRLGTLVTSATFRHPGPLAITVAGVDQMSGGRVELGLGAGWYDDEHHAHGIPYPGLGERFERLEEQLEIVTGMWETPAGEKFSHDGAHYSLVDSPALPKPVQTAPADHHRWPRSPTDAASGRTPSRTSSTSVQVVVRHGRTQRDGHRSM